MGCVDVLKLADSLGLKTDEKFYCLNDKGKYLLIDAHVAQLEFTDLGMLLITDTVTKVTRPVINNKLVNFLLSGLISKKFTIKKNLVVKTEVQN